MELYPVKLWVARVWMQEGTQDIQYEQLPGALQCAANARTLGLDATVFQRTITNSAFPPDHPVHTDVVLP